MKLFFNASLMGKKEFAQNNKAIYDALIRSGHKMLAAPVMDNSTENVAKETAKEASSYYDKLVKWIKAADVCVFETSYPSTSIGHEIAVALGMSKPVIAFHVKEAPKNMVLDSIRDDKLQVIDYSLNKIDLLVDDAIAYALDQSDTRFNFFISPQIGTYLDKVSKERRLPRAVYLRRLIEEDMENTPEFEG